MRPYKLKLSPQQWKWTDLDHVLEISQPMFSDEPYLGYLTFSYRLAFVEAPVECVLQYYNNDGIANHCTFAGQAEAISVYDDFVREWKNATQNMIPIFPPLPR